jgi:hypothetical protein
MSKMYYGKLCVYYGEKLSTTGDHVFGRCFFLVDQRGNLPQVPACADCNGEKSSLEHYLSAVLPFGGRHRDAAENLRTMVPKRLAKNAKLNASLVQGFTGEKLPLRQGQIEKLSEFIVKGLLWHHWQVILGSDDGVVATVYRDAGFAPLRETLSKLAIRDSVQADLGEGTFVYEGIQAREYPQFSVWRLALYGGMYFSDSRLPDEKPCFILARTGRRERLPSGRPGVSPQQPAA